MIEACKVPDGYYVSKFDNDLVLVYALLGERIARIFRGDGAWGGFLDNNPHRWARNEIPICKDPDIEKVILAICTAHRVGING